MMLHGEKNMKSPSRSSSPQVNQNVAIQKVLMALQLSLNIDDLVPLQNRLQTFLQHLEFILRVGLELLQLGQQLFGSLFTPCCKLVDVAIVRSWVFQFEAQIGGVGSDIGCIKIRVCGAFVVDVAACDNGCETEVDNLDDIANNREYHEFCHVYDIAFSAQQR